MTKIGILLLVAVLALGALGVGYAAWTQAVTITGTVNTADYAVEIVKDTLTPSTPDANGAYISDTAVSNNINVVVNGGYPGFVGNAASVRFFSTRPSSSCRKSSRLISMP